MDRPFHHYFKCNIRETARVWMLLGLMDRTKVLRSASWFAVATRGTLSRSPDHNRTYGRPPLATLVESGYVGWAQSAVRATH
jgi:hypothetical protein